MWSTKRVSEYSSSRRYTPGAHREPFDKESAVIYEPNSLKSEAANSPNKIYYSIEKDGLELYNIEFKAGEFTMDEIGIKVEGDKLTVFGKSKTASKLGGLDREFSRQFELPNDVDADSLRAHLNIETRLLKLTGLVITDPKHPLTKTQLPTAAPSDSRQHENNSKSLKTSLQSQPQQNSPFYDSASTTIAQSARSSIDQIQSSFLFQDTESFQSDLVKKVIGFIKQTNREDRIDFEIFLGDELSDGEVFLEIINSATILARIVKKKFDDFGSCEHELKREIKLPKGLKLNEINHGIDSSLRALFIQIPY